MARWDEAVAAYRRAVSLDPQRFDAYDRLGMALLRLGRWEEVVDACLHRLDIVRRADQLAAELGGRLTLPPPLPRKYAWMERSFGWPLTRRAQIALPRCKSSIIQAWETALSCLERPRAIP